MTIFPLPFRCNDIGRTKTSLDRGDVWPVPLRSLTLAGVNTPEKHTRRRRIHFDPSADLSSSYACGATPIAGGDGKSHVPSVWPVPLSASIKRRPEYLDYLQLESTSTMEDNLGSLQKTVVLTADAVIPVNRLNKEQ
jgi:hypothetical protein